MAVVVFLLLCLGAFAVLVMFAAACVAMDKRRRRLEPEDAFDVAEVVVVNIQSEALRAIEQLRLVTEPEVVARSSQRTKR